MQCGSLYSSTWKGQVDNDVMDLGTNLTGGLRKEDPGTKECARIRYAPRDIHTKLKMEGGL